MRKTRTWKGELIGKTILVAEAENETNKGIEGEVIDETRNMLVIQTKNKTKKLIKKQITIKFNNITIEGEEIIGRIEERIKK